VFKRSSLELLLCRVGEEEVLMCPLVPKPLKPTVRISQIPLLLPRDALESSASSLNVSTIRCALRLLHVTGPHILNTHPGGRRAQVMLGVLLCRCLYDTSVTPVVNRHSIQPKEIWSLLP
jgi:hypothetical protein